MRLRQYINESSSKTTVLELVQMLYDKSMPYIKEMAKTGKASDMLSGRNSGKDYFIGKVRKDRQSKDTPQEISDAFDDLFKKKFGWRPRSNSIFVTSKWSTANSYGEVYMIFPIGKYKYIWNRNVEDLWTEIEDSNIYDYYKNGGELPDADQVFDMIVDELKRDYERGNPEPSYDDYETSNEFDEAITEWEMDREDQIQTQAEEEVSQREKDLEYEANIEMKGFIGGYDSGSLDRALGIYGNEIMLNCKEYIAINHKTYYNHVSYFVENFHWKSRPVKEDMIKLKMKNFYNTLWIE